MHITYEFWGKDLPVDKLKKGIPVTHSIIVHKG